ncbi:MAG TPA: hypothetical protein VNW90_17135 [Acetobacteraceae bacterium]|jgi:hypothetical protein|nr:hypothetical protein [Acetobacteraceae bacterium]
MALDRGYRLYSGEEIARGTGCGAVRVVVPLTTATVVMTETNPALQVKPAGTIAALTVLLPPINAMGDGGCVLISFSQIVTSLVVQDSNAGAVETSAGAVSRSNEYRVVQGAWVRWN